MTLRTDDDDDRALERVAARRNVSKHAAALMAIRAMDARDARMAFVDETADRMLEDWGPVFKALAEA
jgi:predicted transcriptional regulator